MAKFLIEIPDSELQNLHDTAFALEGKLIFGGFRSLPLESVVIILLGRAATHKSKLGIPLRPDPKATNGIYKIEDMIFAARVDNVRTWVDIEGEWNERQDESHPGKDTPDRQGK